MSSTEACSARVALAKGHSMTRHVRFKTIVGGLSLLACLSIAKPAMAQNTPTIQQLRQQYDMLMANFERISAARGDTDNQALARHGREVMQGLTDAQLSAVYTRTRIPDLSVVVLATDFLADRSTSATRKPSALLGINTLADFPQPVDVPAGCNGVDISADTRYALLIVKEVANAILAAAAWVCNEDILGENGSLACVPLAIAADIANGFFDTATFCAGEVTANQVDANFRRLDHIHNDLGAGITAIINNDNANASTIILNDNTNTSTIVTNDNINTQNIITNDNSNTQTILTNANANKNELKDLILRTQIEADLAMPDNSAVVALYETPNANGGYLNLARNIVALTISNVLAAGGNVGTAQSMLDAADAAIAAGNFKSAYSYLRRAYKAAGK
jgi:hypothetical protein